MTTLVAPCPPTMCNKKDACKGLCMYFAHWNRSLGCIPAHTLLFVAWSVHSYHFLPLIIPFKRQVITRINYYWHSQASVGVSTEDVRHITVVATQKALLYWVGPLVHPTQYYLHCLAAASQGSRQGTLPVLSGEAFHLQNTPELCPSPVVVANYLNTPLLHWKYLYTSYTHYASIFIKFHLPLTLKLAFFPRNVCHVTRPLYFPLPPSTPCLHQSYCKLPLALGKSNLWKSGV